MTTMSVDIDTGVDWAGGTPSREKRYDEERGGTDRVPGCVSSRVLYS